MTSRFIGYLTDRHLTLYETRNSGWERIRDFEEDQAAAELAGCLHRDKPLHLLADVVEMEFRFEKTTFLRGRDRQALHERKLAQAFRATPYRHAFALGQEPGRRGEEKLLLSAITNPELVAPWVAPLRQRHLSLSGIASVPFLQSLLAAPLAADNPHLLLLTAQGRGGIRITYFFRKEMRFSRLAVHPGEIDALGHVAFEEAVRTHQYLLGLRLIERNSPVDVACLLPEYLMDSWKAAQPSAGVLQFRHIGLHDVVRLAGLKSDQACDSIDDLFLALLVKSGFPNHFAPPAERHNFQLSRLRHSLLAASGLVALAATAASAALLYGALDQQQDASQTEAATAALKSEADKVRQSFPKTSVPTEEIREALTLTRSLAQESAPSRRLLADISRGFDAVPQAELHRLTWTRTDKPELVSGDSQDAPSKAAVPSPAENGGQPLAMRWVALISGDIVGASDYPSANAAVIALRDAIRRDKIRVEILQYPLNVHPDKELKEDFGKPMAPRQPFSLRVTWNE
ncbi:MAG: hypothetical protein H6R10_317 [Rhodocyclaceae bacterium]|nr:hypothetical protein [Rhodocyclaceae bacterium]